MACAAVLSVLVAVELGVCLCQRKLGAKGRDKTGRCRYDVIERGQKVAEINFYAHNHIKGQIRDKIFVSYCFTPPPKPPQP